MALPLILDIVQLSLVVFGTLLTLSPVAAGGMVFMAVGGTGTYVVNFTLLEFRTNAYNESCDLRAGVLFDITASSPVDYDGSFWQALSGLTACLMLAQVGALGFSIALAPKFPIPNRSVWKNEEADKLELENITVEDWDACRIAVFRAVDLFRPGWLLAPAALDKYIYDSDCFESNLQWIEAWKTDTGHDLDDSTLQSMRKVFAYTKLAVKARQKIVLNAQLAHALFILQLVSAVVQLLQHAYRSNRLFWRHTNSYSLSDAILLSAYPTRLFTTIVMYSRVVISMSAVNNFFRELSFLTRALTVIAALWSIIIYIFMSPPDLVAILLFWSCITNMGNIYRRCCLPKRKWKGICAVIFSASTLFLIPFLVHSLSRWLFAPSALESTIILRLCDLERVLLWDVQGYDVSDITYRMFSSLDQNMAGLLVTCLVFAVAVGLVGRYCHKGLGSWTGILGVRAGTLLKAWVLQPEYYASGFHHHDEHEAVAHILGTTWWWHTAGLLNPKYEQQYLHAEKTFYARRRILKVFGLLRVREDGKQMQASLRGCRQVLRTFEHLPCPACGVVLKRERLPNVSESVLLTHISCCLCRGPLLPQAHGISEYFAWFCDSRTCKQKFIVCHMCMHQTRTGDMTWTCERLRALEALPGSIVETGRLFDDQPQLLGIPEEALAGLPDMPTAGASGEPPGSEVPYGGLPAEKAEASYTQKSPKRIKQKRRRRARKDESIAIDVSP